MHIHLKRGLPLTPGRVAHLTPAVTPIMTEIGFSGRDYLGLMPRFKIKTGDRVEPGQTLLEDRRHPQIVIAAPVSGRVSDIRRRHPETGAFSLTIAVDSVEQYPCNILKDWRSRTAVTENLLRSGLWPVLRQRPFGIVADPGQNPGAILICGTAADDYAPDPAPIIEASKEDFDTGVEALRLLSDGPVLVSQAVGPELSKNAVTFEGPFPAGLAGTQIHALHRMNGVRLIWWVNYQETIAIGRLLNKGQVMAERTISVAGPGIDRPLLLKATPCVSISDLTQDFLDENQTDVHSGPLLAGRRDQFLGRHHLQVSILQSRVRQPAWLKIFAVAKSRGENLPKPIIPIAAHEECFPFNIPVVPLLRALAIGDTESAVQMGCLDLVEEDVAVLSNVCPSGNNYATLLRDALDETRRSL